MVAGVFGEIPVHVADEIEPGALNGIAFTGADVEPGFLGIDQSHLPAFPLQESGGANADDTGTDYRCVAFELIRHEQLPSVLKLRCFPLPARLS